MFPIRLGNQRPFTDVVDEHLPAKPGTGDAWLLRVQCHCPDGASAGGPQLAAGHDPLGAFPGFHAVDIPHRVTKHHFTLEKLVVLRDTSGTAISILCYFRVDDWFLRPPQIINAQMAVPCSNGNHIRSIWAPEACGCDVNGLTHVEEIVVHILGSPAHPFHRQIEQLQVIVSATKSNHPLLVCAVLYRGWHGDLASIWAIWVFELENFQRSILRHRQNSFLPM
mmetsp:Transcript_42833/g.72263  ORF Transcript_42833/g.72263 Transcript_42833/m.72263 type:complete len:223 (-) Transcript_42833:303-971(-)